jgi:hypothetical protein
VFSPLTDAREQAWLDADKPIVSFICNQGFSFDTQEISVLTSLFRVKGA